MGYDVISSCHIHGSLKQKPFPFSFNGFFHGNITTHEFPKCNFHGHEN